MFGKKNDPMLPAIKAVMEHNEAERKAVEVVNEHFGITSRRALPLEKLAEYDTAVKRVLAGETLEEGYSKSAVDKEIKKDKRIKGKEAKMIHSLLKGRQKEDEPKKDLKETEQIDEEAINEISKEKLGKYIKAAADDATWAADSIERHMNNKRSIDASKMIKKKYSRLRGINTAVNKIVKKESETVNESISAIWNKFHKNEDNNYHAENRVLLAKHFGTPEEHADAKALYKLHMKRGSLPYGTDLYNKVTKANDRHWEKLNQARENEKKAAKDSLKPKEPGNRTSELQSRVAKATAIAKTVKASAKKGNTYGASYSTPSGEKKTMHDDGKSEVLLKRDGDHALARVKNIVAKSKGEIKNIKKQGKLLEADENKEKKVKRDEVLELMRKRRQAAKEKAANIKEDRIDEVSKDTLKSYVSKATDRQISDGYKAKNDQDVDIDKMKKRDAKIDRAKKLIKRSHLKVVKEDEPKKDLKETEQIDEISKSTLKSYYDKNLKSANKAHKEYDALNNVKYGLKDIDINHREVPDNVNSWIENSIKKSKLKIDNRYKGRVNASDRIGSKFYDRQKYVKETEQLDEISKKTLANYAELSAHDAVRRAHKTELHLKNGRYEKAQKESDKKNKRLEGHSQAITKLLYKEDIAALHEEIAQNIMKKYNSVYEDADQLAAFNESLCEEQRIILEKYFGPNFPNGISKPSPTLTDVARPVAAPAPLTPVAAAPLNAPSAPVAKAGMFGWGGMPKTTPPNLIKPVAPSAPTVTSPAEFAKLRQNINTQMMDRAPAPPSASPAPPVQTAATPTPTVTQTAAPAPSPDPTPTPPVTTQAPAAKPSEPAVQSKARVRQAQAKSQRRVSAPMRPKAKYGYGSNGSGAQDAGSITNRAFGAVNEEDETPIKRSLESILRERYGN